MRADARFVSGLVFGFLFAAALSIGSELFVYDGLLRGTGSLIRRFAVPVLAAPALGSLAARLLSAREPLKIGKPLRLPVWGYALLLLLCWLPVLLAFFPGALNYDFPWQYAQRLEHSYSNLHPLLHSALSNGLVALGEALGSPTLGVLFNTLLQMTAFAFALAYSCVFVQRRRRARMGQRADGCCIRMDACILGHGDFHLQGHAVLRLRAGHDASDMGDD